MTDLFTPNQAAPKDDQPQGSYREALVGEGKKFKDEEALARGKWEADQMIARLTREMDELRDDLNKRMTTEELLEKITSRNAQPNNPTTPESGQQHSHQEVNAMSQEDIQKLVQKTLTVEQQKALAAQNVATVRNKLQEHWGNDFPQKLEQTTKELGVSKEYMAHMAETAPQAFLKLVGADQPRQPAGVFEAPVPNSAVIRGDGNSNVKNYKYFSEMRKADPKKYWSVETQREMHKLAQEQGERFFN